MVARTPEQVAAYRLRNLRESRGMSQEDLAALCAKAGASEYTAMVIHRLERQQRRLNVNDMYALAAILNVSPLVLTMPDLADDEVTYLATRSAPAADVYQWTVGLLPAPTIDNPDGTSRVTAYLRHREYLPYTSQVSGGRVRVEIDEGNIAELFRNNTGKGED